MNCAKAMDAFQKALDRGGATLPEPVRAHIEQCPHCGRLSEQLAEFERVLGDAARQPVAPPPSLHASIMGALDKQKPARVWRFDFARTLATAATIMVFAGLYFAIRENGGTYSQQQAVSLAAPTFFMNETAVDPQAAVTSEFKGLAATFKGTLDSAYNAVNQPPPQNGT